MKKYAEIHKEYQNVSLLWVNVTGKEYISYNPTTAFVSLLKDGYISCLHFKTELSHEHQMIPNLGWHYLSVKKKTLSIIKMNTFKT